MRFFNCAQVGALAGLCLVSSIGLAVASPTSEEAAVLAAVTKNIDAWASYDADKVANSYAPDVTWQNPFGVRIHGRAELKSFLTNLFARPGFRSGKDTSAPAVQDVRLTGPDAAIVWSEESSIGQTQNGKPIGARHSHYLQVFHRTQSGWLITDEMIMDERDLP
jgi:uncharacterized protein (TIGR02246 family)